MSEETYCLGVSVVQFQFDFSASTFFNTLSYIIQIIKESKKKVMPPLLKTTETTETETLGSPLISIYQEFEN
jgi:hypothetical protein